jgi:hypothetical protein
MKVIGGARGKLEHEAVRMGSWKSVLKTGAWKEIFLRIG